MEKLGIEGLKLLVLGLNEIAQAGCALTDGFQPFQDLKEVLDVAKIIPEVVRQRTHYIPEYLDLDEAEMKELNDFTTTNVKLPPNCKTVEEWLDKGIALLIALSGFAEMFFVPQPA